MSDDANSPAEERARALIDEQLRAAGWVVQSQREMAVPRLGGAAIREVVMAPGHGRVDYLRYVDRSIVGVVEATPVGHSLSGVEFQSNTYAQGLPPALRPRAHTVEGRLPFVFEANGIEVHFTNGYDPEPRARPLFGFPQPEMLARWVRRAIPRSATSARSLWKLTADGEAALSMWMPAPSHWRHGPARRESNSTPSSGR